MRLTEHFAVRILEHDIDPALADKLEEVITPHIKDYVPKSPKNWKCVTDFGEEENIFEKINQSGETCIIEFTDLLMKVCDKYVTAVGLPEAKRFIHSWVQSYNGTQYSRMHHHCQNMFDVSGCYYVTGTNDSSPLTIHNPIPFVQGTPMLHPNNKSHTNLSIAKGRLYIFPNWLNHEVQPNQNNETGRTMVGFNYSQRSVSNNNDIISEWLA